MTRNNRGGSVDLLARAIKKVFKESVETGSVQYNKPVDTTHKSAEEQSSDPEKTSRKS